ERRLSHQSAENIHKHSHTLSLSLSLSLSFGYLCLRCSHQSLTSRGRPDHHTPVNSPVSRPVCTHTHTHPHTQGLCFTKQLAGCDSLLWSYIPPRLAHSL